MRTLKLQRIEEKRLFQLLSRYKSVSRHDAELELSLYKKIYREGYSTQELADLEHMSQSTVYRRVKRVDNYIRAEMEKHCT